MKSLLLFIIAITFSPISLADSLMKDMDSLGGNKKLVRMARNIDPKNRVRIVQNRLVDRHGRLELGVNYGAHTGGNPYLETDSLGVSADVHLNPYFSLGLRYYDHSSSLSPEGERRVQQAQSFRAAGLPGAAPKAAMPLNSYMGVINIYPTYGKFNLLNMSVVHFDVYLMGGIGQIQMEKFGNGLTEGYSTETYTGGGGLGVWWNNHLSTRFEARYQTYEEQRFDDDSKNIGATIFSASIGVLL